VNAQRTLPDVSLSDTIFRFTCAICLRREFWRILIWK